MKTTITLIIIFTAGSTWAAQPTGIRAGQKIDQALTTIEASEGKDFVAAVHSLREDLDAKVAAGERIDKDARRRLSEVLGRKAARVNRGKDDGEQTYINILNLAVRHGDWDSVKAEVFQAFESSKSGRVTLLRTISGKTTSLSKDEAVQAINELESRKLIEKGDKWREVARISPEEYLPKLKQELLSTKDPREFQHMALIIESHNDETVFSQVVPRMRELGLDKPSPNGGYSWIDHRLFAKYLKKTEGDALVAALEVLEMGGGSVISAGPIILERGLLNHSDRRVRAMAVGQISKGIGERLLSPDAAEKLFNERLSEESDPEVRKRLNDGLSATRAYRKAFNRLDGMNQPK
jgi:hypothetical protein